jgi:chromosome segregation ATPase
MSEDRTADMDGHSFEERVFARFDAIDSRLGDMDARLQKLEAKQYDTKPVWERALAELLGLQDKVDNLSRKIDVLSMDMIQLRADQGRTERRLDQLESR